MTTPESFDRAAALILDTVEMAFGIVAPNGRSDAHKAIVNVLHYYCLPRAPALPGYSPDATGQERSNTGTDGKSREDSVGEPNA